MGNSFIEYSYNLPQFVRPAAMFLDVSYTKKLIINNKKLAAGTATKEDYSLFMVIL